MPIVTREEEIGRIRHSGAYPGDGYACRYPGGRVIVREWDSDEVDGYLFIDEERCARVRTAEEAFNLLPAHIQVHFK